MGKLKIKNLQEKELIAENIFLVLPGIIYWTSALMSAAMGTDYFYDVAFAQLNSTLTGRLFFGLLILVFPIAATILNLVMYRNKKLKWLRGGIGLGGLLAVMGGLALGRLFSAA